jgi:hypothetical protein
VHIEWDIGMGQLYFKKYLQDAIRAGTKTTTIRRWKSPFVHAGRDAYVPGFGWLVIEAVEPIELAQLSDADAVADGFASLSALLAALKELYPDQADDGKRWFRVRFRRRDVTPAPTPTEPGLFRG